MQRSQVFQLQGLIGSNLGYIFGRKIFTAFPAPGIALLQSGVLSSLAEQNFLDPACKP